MLEDENVLGGIFSSEYLFADTIRPREKFLVFGFYKRQRDSSDYGRIVRAKVHQPYSLDNDPKRTEGRGDSTHKGRKRINQPNIYRKPESPTDFPGDWETWSKRDRSIFVVGSEISDPVRQPERIPIAEGLTSTLRKLPKQHTTAP